jgi:hypothetical protein
MSRLTVVSENVPRTALQAAGIGSAESVEVALRYAMGPMWS